MYLIRYLNRFEEILSGLHFHDKETPPANTDRYVKLGTFMKQLLHNFMTTVIPGEFLCLDESLIPFKGRVSFRQFNPMKRARFGLLFYILMDCRSGMAVDLLPYQGKTTNLPPDLVKALQRGGATVVTMLEPYLDKGHKVVADNFFNSPGLANYLLEKRTFMVGTCQKRRKGMPKMTGKMKKGDVKVYCNGNIMLERWMDRREVVMMNTFIPHGMTHVNARNPHNSRPKPNSVVTYNKQMGMVDSMDSTIKPLSHHRKTYKWYKKAFFHLITMAVYQSFRAFKLLRTDFKSTYQDFLLKVVEQLLADNPSSRKPIGRPLAIGSKQKPKKEPTMHIPLKLGKGDCVVCRKQKKRGQTTIKCQDCNVRLCLQKGQESCYSKFHADLMKVPCLPMHEHNDQTKPIHTAYFTFRLLQSRIGMFLQMRMNLRCWMWSYLQRP